MLFSCVNVAVVSFRKINRRHGEKERIQADDAKFAYHRIPALQAGYFCYCLSVSFLHFFFFDEHLSHPKPLAKCLKNFFATSSYQTPGL